LGPVNARLDGIDKRLGEGFVHGCIWEAIGAVGGMVVDKDSPTFETAFVVEKKFAFGV